MIACSNESCALICICRKLKQVLVGFYATNVRHMTKRKPLPAEHALRLTVHLQEVLQDLKDTALFLPEKV